MGSSEGLTRVLTSQNVSEITNAERKIKIKLIFKCFYKLEFT